MFEQAADLTARDNNIVNGTRKNAKKTKKWPAPMAFGRKRRKINPEVIQAVIKMLDEGCVQASIASKYGISRATVGKIKKKEWRGNNENHDIGRV